MPFSKFQVRIRQVRKANAAVSDSNEEVVYIQFQIHNTAWRAVSMENSANYRQVQPNPGFEINLIWNRCNRDFSLKQKWEF